MMLQRLSIHSSRFYGGRLLGPLLFSRTTRYQAFDAGFDVDELHEARAWHGTFDGSQLPKGQTSYARSSGPGGQHVNKTESKAITTWRVKDLEAVLPKLLHPGIKASKYYTARSESLTFQAQTHRQRSANADENIKKLVDELKQIYDEAVPRETNPEKKTKHRELEKTSNESRLRQKKQQSLKKQARRGFDD